MAPPVQPFFGSVLLTGVAPANCDMAATAPAMFCWSNAPNAPLHSDMIASLIGVPEPPLRGATAGCGAGASAGAGGGWGAPAGAAGAGVLFDESELAALLSDELLSLSLLLPHAATTSASTTATVSASHPRPGLRTDSMIAPPPRKRIRLNRRVWARPTPSPASCPPAPG